MGADFARINYSTKSSFEVFACLHLTTPIVESLSINHLSSWSNQNAESLRKLEPAKGDRVH